MNNKKVFTIKKFKCAYMMFEGILDDIRDNDTLASLPTEHKA